MIHLNIAPSEVMGLTPGQIYSLLDFKIDSMKPPNHVDYEELSDLLDKVKKNANNR